MTRFWPSHVTWNQVQGLTKVGSQLCNTFDGSVKLRRRAYSASPSELASAAGRRAPTNNAYKTNLPPEFSIFSKAYTTREEKYINNPQQQHHSKNTKSSNLTLNWQTKTLQIPPHDLKSNFKANPGPTKETALTKTNYHPQTHTHASNTRLSSTTQ